MGANLIVNYIVKSNEVFTSNLIDGVKLTVKKEGIRHYAMGCPLYFADKDWNILGKCQVLSQVIADNHTFVDVIVLCVFSKEDSETVTRLNKLGESLLIR